MYDGGAIHCSVELMGEVRPMGSATIALSSSAAAAMSAFARADAWKPTKKIDVSKEGAVRAV